MNLALEHFARDMGIDAQNRVLLVLDQAGWHKAKKIVIPDNISILHLPPYSPELNTEEKPWSWLRQHHLGNRVFLSVDEIVLKKSFVNLL